MNMITQPEHTDSPAERARDYLAKAAPVDRMRPSQLMLDLRLARTHIELLLRETGEDKRIDLRTPYADHLGAVAGDD